jgi:hypothetical protein
MTRSVPNEYSESLHCPRFPFNFLLDLGALVNKIDVAKVTQLNIGVHHNDEDAALSLVRRGAQAAACIDLDFSECGFNAAKTALKAFPNPVLAYGLYSPHGTRISGLVCRVGVDLRLRHIAPHGTRIRGLLKRAVWESKTQHMCGCGNVQEMVAEAVGW